MLSYATTTAVYTKGTAITPDTPTNSGGTVSTYTVVPNLPAGLVLNATTGVISGTPAAVAAQALYEVSGVNAGGTSAVSLTITVNDIAPAGLTYGVNPAVYAANAAISPDVPSWSSTGGVPTSFAVQGSLPQGLALDPATGILSGTPASMTAQANYTIVATNSGGSTNSTLTITVIPQAPYFITQPASQYVGSGITTSFGVNVGGDIGGTLSYQWYKNATAISGTNNFAYVTPVLSSTDNGEQFYVVVTDNYSRTITSSTATLNIKGVSGTFSNTGTPSIARTSATATLLQNGQVLIVGGRNGNSTLQSAELYDPATGLFTVTGSMSTARVGHSATLLANGKVLVAGGTPAVFNATLASAELYDPTTGVFTTTGSLSMSRAGHSDTLLSSGKVLIAGGSTSPDGFTFTTLGSAELYDPVAGAFSSTGSLNTARFAPAVLLNNGQVLIAGGYDPSYLASAELYDPVAGTFSVTTGSLTTARSANTATLLQNGDVLIAAGSGANSSFLTSAEVYDPSTGNFTVTGSLNNERANQTATLLPSGQVLIVGEITGATTQQLNITELYDPVSGVFVLNASTNTSRFYSTATLLQNGQVLITGQETAAIVITPPSPAELYQP